MMFTEVSCAKSNKKLSLYNDVQKSKKVPLSCAVVIREREREKRLRRSSLQGSEHFACSRTDPIAAAAAALDIVQTG